MKKNIEFIYPLSPSQQGMLFETSILPHSGIYIEQAIWQMTGDLHTEAFERAWMHVLQRHASLRTAFIWQEQQEPLQVVLREVQLPIEQADWQELFATQQQEHLTTYLQRIRSEGFVLSKAPLLRVGVFRLRPDTYQCILSFHHILMDGWCLPVLMKDLFMFYQTFRQGTAPSITPALPYVEYIRWLKRQDLAQAESFWRNTLHGFNQPTPLGRMEQPTPSQELTGMGFSGKNTPGVVTARQPGCSSIATPVVESARHRVFPGFSEINPYLSASQEGSLPIPALSRQENGYGEQTATLSPTDTAKLRTLVNQHRLTLNTLLQGVWAVLLSRYSGSADVVFGATVSGRPADLPGVETMLGLFINTLPVRLTLAPEASFLTWLATVQTCQRDQRPYEFCSAGQIHQWSALPGAVPLYESILVFENYPTDISAIFPTQIDLDLHDFNVIGAQTAYPLTIVAIPAAELMIKLVYNRQRFESSAIMHILDHLRLMLHKILDDPNVSIQALFEAIPDDHIPVVAVSPTIQRQSASAAYVPPLTPVERTLAQLWQTILGVEQISVDANFFDLGGHSLIALRLVAEIQRQFGKTLPLTTFFQAPTITQLARLLDEQHADTTFTPLVRMQPNGRKRPLFCVHAVDGGVFYYNELAQYLAPDRPFYGIQAYGLEPGTAVLTSVETMAAQYIEAIRAVSPNGPYFIAGYSSGGLHAYEMARQLQQAGETVALLALIDMPPYYDVFEETGHFLALMRMISEYIRFDLVQAFARTRQIDVTDEAVRAELQRLSGRERLEVLGTCIHTSGAFPPGVSTDRMDRIIQVFSATNEAVGRYQVQPYDGHIVLFRSADDLRRRIAEDDYGWGQYVRTPLELYDVPGTHFTLIREPNVQVLARHLKHCLDSVEKMP